LILYSRTPWFRADVFQHEFNFRNKASLLTEIQRSTKKGVGLSVRALKESWKEAPQAIEELEKEGEVLVIRTLKDGQLRVVFWNEVKPDEDNGGAPVEKGDMPPQAGFVAHVDN
jgi:transcription initiation factor TFIIE subunit beta